MALRQSDDNPLALMFRESMKHKKLKYFINPNKQQFNIFKLKSPYLVYVEKNSIEFAFSIFRQQLIRSCYVLPSDFKCYLFDF